MEQEIIITPEIEEQSIEVIAEQGVVPTGTIYITENGITDVSSYANANVDVDFNLQDKDVSITQNGTEIITADEGYMGMSSVSINTNVPPSKYSPQYVKFQSFTGTSLLEETQQLDTSKMDTFDNMFSYCTNLTSFDFSGFKTPNVTKMSNMFSYTFGSSRNSVDLDLSSFTSEKLTDIQSMFTGCSYLKSVNLSSLTTGIQNISYLFNNCNRLETIDLSKMDFSGLRWYGNAFYNCGINTSTGLTIIYVKDADAQNWILNQNNGHPSTWSTANVIIKS